MADSEKVNPLVGPAPADTITSEQAADTAAAANTPTGEVAQAQEDMTETPPEPKQYDYSVTYKAGEETLTQTGHVTAVDDDDAKAQVQSKYEHVTYERTVTETVVVQSVSVNVSGEPAADTTAKK